MAEKRKAKPTKTSKSHEVRRKSIEATLADAKKTSLTRQQLENPTLEDDPTKVGRPTTYKPEYGKIICDRVAAGWTVRQACFDLPFNRVQVYSWARCIPEFATAFAHARDLWLDGLSDEMKEIADTGQNDWMVIESKTGREFVKLNDEAVRRSQLRLEVRYKILGAFRAQQWGKKLDVTSGGEKLEGFAAALQALAKQDEDELQAPPPAEAPRVEH